MRPLNQCAQCTHGVSESVIPMAVVAGDVVVFGGGEGRWGGVIQGRVGVNGGPGQMVAAACDGQGGRAARCEPGGWTCGASRRMVDSIWSATSGVIVVNPYQEYRPKEHLGVTRKASQRVPGYDRDGRDEPTILWLCLLSLLQANHCTLLPCRNTDREVHYR